MRQLFVFTLAMLTLCFAACTAQTPQNSNSAPTGTTPAKPPGEMSPSETYLAYTEAARKKDLTEVEKFLSKGTIELLNQAAQAEQATVDEQLSRLIDDINQQEEPETRNETINGNEASIEYKNPVTAGWDKLPLVKEDGRWKIALNKLVEETMKESEGEMNDRELSTDKPEKSTPDESNSQSNTQSNKQ